MHSSVDVAVIGSGFGGLTGAALAAHSGLRTAVFERHTRPGGCAGDFGLEGFTFPAGATVVTGLEPGGILHQVFAKLDKTVTCTHLDPSIVFHLGGRTVPYVASHREWRRVFSETFPSAPAGYLDFWDWVERTGDVVYQIGASLPSLPLRRPADFRRTIRAAHPRALRTVPLLWATVGGIKRKYGAVGHRGADSLIAALLLDATGATADECSAIQGAIALDLYRRGCQWVPGGTAGLAMELVRSIRGDQGEVHFRTGIKRIERRGRRWRLLTDDNREVVAASVIANVPPAGLDRLLGREERLPAAGTAWGAFVVHLGIDATGIGPVHPYHQVVSANDDVHEPGGSCLVSIFPGRAQKSHRWSISVSTHVAVSRDEPLTACSRQRLEQKLLTHVETVIPDVRSRVCALRSATPATFERFTSRPGGFVGGVKQVPGVVALRAPGHRPASGLFLAGDHVFPGQGTVGTALSGINAYRDAAEYLGRKAIL